MGRDLLPWTRTTAAGVARGLLGVIERGGVGLMKAGRTHGGGELLCMGRVASRDVGCRREGGMVDLRLDLARQRSVMDVMNRGR
ncbi:hypothetical protein ACLOJK_036326 [Asimina triloba]